MHKRYIILLLLLPVQLFAGNFDPVKDLIQRRVPWLTDHVVFEKIISTAGFSHFPPCFRSFR